MYLKCLDEYRAKIKGRPVIFEETASFGYVYEVDEKVGKKLLSTEKFAPCSADEAKKLEVITITEPGPVPEPPPSDEVAAEPEAEPELLPEGEPADEPETPAEEPANESEPELVPEPEEDEHA